MSFTFTEVVSFYCISNSGEHVLELAMYLDMLNCNCFPTWPHVFAIAEQVMMRLQEQDQKLHDHLKHIAPINAQVNPKVSVYFILMILHLILVLRGVPDCSVCFLAEYLRLPLPCKDSCNLIGFA